MKSKLAWFSVMMFGVILLGMTTVYAADVQPEPADLTHQKAMDDHTAELEEIAANREAVIEELVANWFIDESGWKQEFRSALDLANDSKLLAVSKAGSYAEVQAILSGGSPDFYSADNMADPFELGDTDKDFVYTPVTPCRIINTWNAGGPLGSGETRGFYVHGNVSGQGGNPAGCPSPRGEPRAVHINVTVADTTANGYLSAWPYGIAMPLPRTSILNYKPNASDPICNALTLKTGYLLAKDINIYALRKTDLIVDVLGYYYNVDEDDYKVRFAGSSASSFTILPNNFECTHYPGGEVTIFAPGPGKIMVTAQALLRLRSHTTGSPERIIVYIGSSPTECTAYNYLQGYHWMGWVVPGALNSFSNDLAGATVSVSRTFTITSAGSKKYYLNGIKDMGNGEGGITATSMQAVYYPDM